MDFLLLPFLFLFSLFFEESLSAPAVDFCCCCFLLVLLLVFDLDCLEPDFFFIEALWLDEPLLESFAFSDANCCFNLFNSLIKSRFCFVASVLIKSYNCSLLAVGSASSFS